MEEAIDRFLAGNYDHESGSLDFSCSKLEITMKKGECPEGSFTVHGVAGRPCEGKVYASDGRMECITDSFTGGEQEIAYRFHGENLEEGDVVKGEIYLISSQGEYYLPFVVSVEYAVLASSLGNVRNLFHFANLAKANPAEAVELFYSKDFARVFSGNDRQYYEYYRGLSKDPGNEQNVEEFLIGINKKQRIEYLYDTEEIRLENPEEDAEVSFTVTRNGWGFGRLWIYTDGDFLRTARELITDEDFAGSSCRVTLALDCGRLHAGNNVGAVRLWNSYGEKCIPVTVKCRGAGRRHLERKKLIVQLMEHYQAFRLKKISAASWMRESAALVDRLNAADEDDVFGKLFQAQLLITEERFNEAQWILDHAADLMESLREDNAVMESYYLYLTTLIHRDEEYVNRILERVEYLFKRNPGEWRIAWLLLYLSGEYNRSFTKKWMFLEEQFYRGASSPVFYIEALILLNLNPSLLTRLGRFEQRLLRYGAKHEALNPDVTAQFVYLVQREREYSDSLLGTLKLCYKTRPDDDVLREICSMLIKGNRAGAGYFDWYSLGVEKQLRITRLYEYYMMSVDLSDPSVELPKIVLMYFSYENSLSYETAAFLYADVYKNREKYAELYDSYRPKMEQFVREQILNRRINRNLAYLYKNVLEPEMITGDLALALADLIFLHLVQVSGDNIKYVIVCRYGLCAERKYPVVGGQAYVPISDSESRLIFEDAFGNRCMAGVPHTIEKLILPRKLIRQIVPYVGNVQELNLFLCLNGHETAEMTGENAARFEYLFADPEVEKELRREIGIRLLQYYYDNDMIRELDTYLDGVEPEAFSEKERAELIRYLVARGKEEKAYEWLVRFGPYGVEPKTLVRLCSHMIRTLNEAEDKHLTQAVWYAFKRGKYDEHCLHYLTLYFRGMTRDLRNVYKAAKDFEVDTYELSERMLGQMLVTGSFVGEKMDIFRTYVLGGGRNEVKEAFLTQCSYDYFVRERMTERYAFDEILRLYRQGEELHTVCKLAVIKYYAENVAEADEETKKILRIFIRELMARHIHLKMFAEFDALNDPLISQLKDKTIVEYRAAPGARAIMHYCIERSGEETATYRTEEMQEVFGGVCFKEFVLFFGERLQYYIMEEQDGKEQLTESATLQRSDTLGFSDGKFGLINDISISNTLQDYETVDRLLGELAWKEYMTKGLFRLN